MIHRARLRLLFLAIFLQLPLHIGCAPHKSTANTCINDFDHPHLALLAEQISSSDSECRVKFVVKNVSGHPIVLRDNYRFAYSLDLDASEESRAFRAAKDLETDPQKKTELMAERILAQSTSRVEAEESYISDHSLIKSFRTSDDAYVPYKVIIVGLWEDSEGTMACTSGSSYTELRNFERDQNPGFVTLQPGEILSKDTWEASWKPVVDAALELSFLAFREETDPLCWHGKLEEVITFKHSVRQE